MEGVDSQISDDKSINNRSILSFNYIYKKAKIRDNFLKTVQELRTLNYEKIAKYRMKKMNLIFLLNSLFKFKNNVKENNPLLKYIKGVRPYTNISIKLKTPEKELIMNKYFQNKILNKFPKNEKILNFLPKIQNFKNFYYSRISNNEYKKISHNRNEKIILIQKHIRGFLSKRIIDEEINKIIAQKIIHKILIIQRGVRNLLNKKNSLSHLIVNIIQNERAIKGNKITDIFCLYHQRNLYKKNLIIQKILKVRNESIILIQHKYRSYRYIRKIKEILEKERKSYVLTYPFIAESVQIKIYMSSSYKFYEFFRCPIRKYFVLYIEKGTIPNGEYLCNIIVNNNIILDRRYKYIVGKNNALYNLIYIGETPKEPKSLSKKEINITNKNVNSNDKKHLNKVKNDYNNDILNVNKTEGKKEKKEKKKKNKNIVDEILDNDFFFYCYNDNSNSTNSYSTKSDHEKNQNRNNQPESNDKKIQTKGHLESNKINKQNLNEILKANNQKNESNMPKAPSVRLNNKYIKPKNKKIFFKKKDDFENYFKKKMNKTNNNSALYLTGIKNPKQEYSVQSENNKYNNILNELCPSISSSSKSNISMKNINCYSKKTHKGIFCSNYSEKSTSKNENSTNYSIKKYKNKNSSIKRSIKIRK